MEDFTNDADQESIEISTSVNHGLGWQWVVAIGAVMLGTLLAFVFLGGDEGDSQESAEQVTEEAATVGQTDLVPPPLFGSCPSGASFEIGQSAGGSVKQTAFTADGRFRTYGTDGRIVTWDVATGEQLDRTEVFRDFVSLSPDGLWMAVFQFPGEQIRMVNLDDPEVGFALDGSQQQLDRGQFSADGRFFEWVDVSPVVARPLNLFRVELATGEQTTVSLEPQPTGIESADMRISPDSSALVAPGSWSGVAQAWDTTGGGLQKLPDALELTRYPDYEPDNNGWLARGLEQQLVGTAPAGRLVEIRTGNDVTDRFGLAEVDVVVNDSTLRLLAVVDQDSRTSTFTVWDVEADQAVLPPQEIGGALRAISFDHDQRHMAFVDQRGKARLVSLVGDGSSRIAAPLGGHAGSVAKLAVSDGADLVATIGTYDRRLRLWDVPTGAGLRTDLSNSTSIRRTVRFDADEGMALVNGSLVIEREQLAGRFENEVWDYPEERLIEVDDVASTGWPVLGLDGSGRAVIWSPAHGAVNLQPSAMLPGIRRLSGDGRIMALASGAGSARGANVFVGPVDPLDGDFPAGRGDGASQGEVDDLALDDDGDRAAVAVTRADGVTLLRLVDTTDWTLLAEVPIGKPDAVALSPNGASAAVIIDSTVSLYCVAP